MIPIENVSCALVPVGSGLTAGTTEDEMELEEAVVALRSVPGVSARCC